MSILILCAFLGDVAYNVFTICVPFWETLRTTSLLLFMSGVLYVFVWETLHATPLYFKKI